MIRRAFIKGSAILGASVATGSILLGQSGLLWSKSSRKVYQILDADRAKVGTLPILRAFAGNHVDYVSPFVLLDEFGPVSMKPGADPLKVDAHPHAGVVPTTYILSGAGHHKDSLNYDFQIEQGDFMLFNSGRGAIHMEESGAEIYKKGGLIHGFQIWLNLPAANKFMDPSTSVFKEEHMGSLSNDNYEAKVILGDLFDAKSTVDLISPAFYYHIQLKPDGRIDIPTDPTHNAFVYLVNGSVETSEQKVIKANQIALYQRGDSLVNLYSQEGAELLVLGGQPLNEPVFSYGPFVMNTEEQIRLCIRNYQMGKMGNPALVN